MMQQKQEGPPYQIDQHGHAGMKAETAPAGMLSSQLRLQIDLNAKSYQQVLQKMSEEQWGIGLVNSGVKNMIVKEFFVKLIQGGATTPTRHLTIETINRYIFVLNVVQESPRGHISEVRLRNKIKLELEKDKGYEMDKKTLRRIVENLRVSGLVKTKQFKVTIYQDRVASTPRHGSAMRPTESAQRGAEASPVSRPTRARRQAARTQKYFEESSSNVYDSESADLPKQKNWQVTKKTSIELDGDFQFLNKEIDSSFDDVSVT